MKAQIAILAVALCAVIMIGRKVWKEIHAETMPSTVESERDRDSAVVGSIPQHNGSSAITVGDYPDDRNDDPVFDLVIGISEPGLARSIKRI